MAFFLKKYIQTKHFTKWSLLDFIWNNKYTVQNEDTGHVLIVIYKTDLSGQILSAASRLWISEL